MAKVKATFKPTTTTLAAPPDYPVRVMPNLPDPPQQKYFSKVKEAREVLRARAKELIDQLLLNAKDAQANGEYQVAAQSLQWLLEHMPPDDEGGTVIVQSIDKPRAEGQRTGPSINIGFALGGVNQTPKELPPAQVIDVKVIDNE